MPYRTIFVLGNVFQLCMSEFLSILFGKIGKRCQISLRPLVYSDFSTHATNRLRSGLKRAILTNADSCFWTPSVLAVSLGLFSCRPEQDFFLEKWNGSIQFVFSHNKSLLMKSISTVKRGVDGIILWIFYGVDGVLRVMNSICVQFGLILYAVSQTKCK